MKCGARRSVKKALGPLFVASNRFGLRQGDKIRVIDDLAASLVSMCFGAVETIDLGGVDEIAAIARSWLDMIGDDSAVRVVLSDGAVRQGTLAPGLTVDDARSLVGRTLDQEAAYKQILIKESSVWVAPIVVTDPGDGKARLFVPEVLPFGASAAVYGCNRFARALGKVGTRLLYLVWGTITMITPTLTSR